MQLFLALFGQERSPEITDTFDLENPNHFDKFFWKWTLWRQVKIREEKENTVLEYLNKYLHHKPGADTLKKNKNKSALIP